MLHIYLYIIFNIIYIYIHTYSIYIYNIYTTPTSWCRVILEMGPLKVLATSTQSVALYPEVTNPKWGS